MLAGGLLAAMCFVSTAQAAVYTYVGSWAVADGPLWSGPDAPGIAPSLSARQAAAFLFGGVYTDYAISTNGSNPNTVNLSAHLDGYADTQYITGVAGQDFVGIVGANYQSGPGNYSAYVFDHACGIHYCDNGGGDQAFNYAFKISNAVPEPATWAMMLIGFAGLGLCYRRRQVALAA
jgi:PEP-CTERM motif